MDIIVGDKVILTSILSITFIVFTVMCVITQLYLKVYLKSEREENLIKIDPSRKHYLVTRGEYRTLRGSGQDIITKSVPVYDGPGRETTRKATVEPCKLITSNKYEVGYYYIDQFNGWVSCDDVVKIPKKDAPKYEPILSVNHKQHKFSVVISDPNAQIHGSPDFLSRVKYEAGNEMIELNQPYRSDRYEHNWYYLDRFGGWVHESFVKSRNLY